MKIHKADDLFLLFSDLSYVEEIRSQIPIKHQQRNDLYNFKCMKDF